MVLEVTVGRRSPDSLSDQKARKEQDGRRSPDSFSDQKTRKEQDGRRSPDSFSDQKARKEQVGRRSPDGYSDRMAWKEQVGRNSPGGFSDRMAGKTRKVGMRPEGSRNQVRKYMNIRLIALDLDGTLTNDKKEITPRTFDALMDAQKAGVRLALASARPAPGLYKICDELHMREYGGILMSYNGGRIVEASTGKTLYETCMDMEETKEILRFLDTLPVNVILDDGVQFYVKDPKAYKIEYECWNNQMTCTQVDDLAEFLHFSPVKLLMSVQPEILPDVQKQIAEHLPESLIVVRTAPFYLEIIPASINKGKGIRDICKVLGIDPAETAAFGDAENDIPMIKEAGFGVAMGNAEDAVKAAADYVTASNNEDGIPLALDFLRGA